MAYQQGDTITATDYNNFVANINAVISTGSSDSGYGLTAISDVSVGATISAAQWNSLLDGLQTAANHQGTTLTNASNTVTTGGNILPLANLGTDIGLIDTNRLTADVANMSTGVTGTSSSRTTAWSGTVSHTFTVTYADANAARYFFNSGGKIKFAFSRSGGTTSDQNTSWTNLLSGLGTIEFGAQAAQSTGSSGFYDLTGTPASVYNSAVGSGAYSATM